VCHTCLTNGVMKCSIGHGGWGGVGRGGGVGGRGGGRGTDTGTCSFVKGLRCEDMYAYDNTI
jgi:hypothetical protein